MKSSHSPTNPMWHATCVQVTPQRGKPYSFERNDSPSSAQAQSEKRSHTPETEGGILTDVENVIPKITISPAKRSSADLNEEEEEEENGELKAGSTGSLPKRAKPEDGLPRSSSVVEFQDLPITLL